VVEDEIVFLRGQTTLPANGILQFSVPANGRTWRVNQAQEPYNPHNTFVTAVVEGCRTNAGTISTGFVNQLPNETNDPSVSTVCMTVRGGYDPNEKLAFPEGVNKKQHFIEANTPIDYQIGFQNTGNFTAFNIIVQDTLDAGLDPSTIEMGASSHPFTWQLSGKNVLTFRFEDINLIDSFSNEPKSHGHVKFRIGQKAELALGTRIENRAAIYFDFNKPVFTNKTFHTIGKDFLTVNFESVSDLKTLIRVSPNPFADQTIFELDPSVQSGIFELFDLNGKALRREKIGSNLFVFDRKDLKTGIFIFKVTNSEGRMIGQGKIVAQ
jgi:uncharacterized repeat protein (TIGR01451 family)